MKDTKCARVFFVQLKCGVGGFVKWTREDDFRGIAIRN